MISGLGKKVYVRWLLSSNNRIQGYVSLSACIPTLESLRARAITRWPQILSVLSTLETLIMTEATRGRNLIEALASPEAGPWIAAITKEIDSLLGNKT